jgi:4-hydroxy-tetrahydrodipicolinate synthase
MQEIGRLLTAMVTPMDDEGKVDYAQARRLAQALVESGSHGVVVSGTTGEAPTLSDEEKVRLIREVKEALGHRGTVVAGTGTYDTAHSIELSREAQKAGADALLLVVPYYNRPSQEGLYEHFRAIAQAVDIPCILYNIPGRTALNMTADTTIRLSQVDNIIGVKEASGDLVQISRILAEARQGFLVWSGDDALTLPIMAVGGYGVISVTSHLVGGKMRAMMEAYLEGRVEEARRLHLQLLPLMQALMTVAPNPCPIKWALNHVGFRVGRPRLPLVEPDPQGQERLRRELARIQLDLKVPV